MRHHRGLGRSAGGAGRVDDEQSEGVVRAQPDAGHQRGEAEGEFRAVRQGGAREKNQGLRVRALRGSGPCGAGHAGSGRKADRAVEH